MNIENINSFLRSRGILPQTAEWHTHHKNDVGTWMSIKEDIFVLYSEENMRKKECTTLVTWLLPKSYTHKFVICRNISSQSCLLLTKHNIEHLKYEMVKFTRDKHIFVPKYTMLTKREIKTLCDRYSCGIDKFPLILHTDPQVKYLGVPKGSVLYNMSDDIYRVVT